MDDHELIDSIIETLRAIREKVPQYEQLKPKQMQALVRVAYLDPAFMDAGIAAMTNDARFEQATGWTSEELRQEVGAIHHWLAVETELGATLRGVSASILKRRYEVGLNVLLIYRLLEQLIRDPQNSDLIPFFENMRQLNRSGTKRQAAEPQEPEPEPDE